MVAFACAQVSGALAGCSPGKWLVLYSGAGSIGYGIAFLVDGVMENGHRCSLHWRHTAACFRWPHSALWLQSLTIKHVLYTAVYKNLL